ncbi:MAG: glycosyltransferase [Spirochaetales bacterium]|nr:MAG: glycosyltransferase [Spirochaetales bacterium]
MRIQQKGGFSPPESGVECLQVRQMPAIRGLSMYWFLMCLLGAYVLVMAVLNLFYRFRIPHSSPRTGGPLVSILVPARNEEANIAACLDSLFTQTYRNYEIIVLDDNSTDRTMEILKNYKAKHPGLRILSGGRKPEEWKGKTYAVHQLAEAAAGDFLYMTDADTIHKPEAVAWAVDRMIERKLDAFSAMPVQKTRTFFEKLIVPIVYLPMFMLPYSLLNSKKNRRLSFAIGQLFVFKKEAYKEMGGFEAVKGRITEDQAVSRLLKKNGFNYQFLDTRGLVECRMYGSLKECFNGFAKNFHEMVAYIPFLITILILIMLALVVVPVILLGGSIGTSGTTLTALSHALPGMLPGSTLLLVLPMAAFFTGWAVNLFFYRLSWYMPLLYPLFFTTFAVMLLSSIFNVATGRNPVWKSRVLSPSSAAFPAAAGPAQSASATRTY